MPKYHEPITEEGCEALIALDAATLNDWLYRYFSIAQWLFVDGPDLRPTDASGEASTLIPVPKQTDLRH